MINLQDRKIVLIGGAGFIGHNLALRLNELGAKVEIFDSLQVNNLAAFCSTDRNVPNRSMYLRFITERLDLLRNAGIPLHVIDARDYNTMNNSIVKSKPQVIVHLAAVAHAGKSNKDPFSTFDHSFRTLENALDIARDEVEHFIYFSSSMVYGNFATETVSEDTLCDPLGIYGALKFSGEKIVIAYKQVFDLDYTIIRPSALYGERCVSRRVGQVFIENAMNGKPVTVSGDGSEALDFTYIDDLVDGIVKTIENENSRNEIFNLTYGESRTIAQMLDVLKEHFPDVKVEHENWDKLMPKRGTLSVEKARRLIGYNPSFPVEKGYVKYIQWYKSHAH